MIDRLIKILTLIVLAQSVVIGGTDLVNFIFVTVFNFCVFALLAWALLFFIL